MDHLANLKNSIRNGRVSHAYILAGEAGSGRGKIAESFALALLCEEGTGEPCGSCHACVQTLAGTNPDLIRIRADKASIGVDEIRQKLNDTARIKPFAGRYKVYIIYDAEKMTPAAQNALLKTMEEPPDYAVIILITAREDALLETVRSRCISLKVFREENSGRYEEYLEENLAILSGETGTGSLRERGKGAEADFVEFVRLFFGDVLKYKKTAGMTAPVFAEKEEVTAEMAGRLSYEKLGRILEAADKAQQRLEYNVNPDLCLMLMLEEI